MPSKFFHVKESGMYLISFLLLYYNFCHCLISKNKQQTKNPQNYFS